MKNEAEVLMVDDNPADVDLTCEVLKRSKGHFHVNTVEDGEEAMLFLRCQGTYAAAPRPDIILLDLNLPRKDGREVLSEMRSDPRLARIPVVVFTTSQASSDVNRSYELGANCYLRKPGNLADFTAVVQSMADFWLNCASLPQREKR
jgi:two-component system, chemotaxis family, response regulator Rcp1